jgi:preprotein translocase subunit SecY
LPKEIADYLNKMGARIPNIKPGKATIEYLTKIQASTRFWGMYFFQSNTIYNFNFIQI